MASAHHGWLAMGSRAFWKEVVNLKEHIKKDMQKPTNDMPKKNTVRQKSTWQTNFHPPCAQRKDTMYMTDRSVQSMDISTTKKNLTEPRLDQEPDPIPQTHKT